MSPSFWFQAFGFLGAMIILVAYVAMQMKRMDPNSVIYNSMNAVGGMILAYIAFHPFQIGFVILEGTWAVVSVLALVRALRKPGANLSE